MRRGTSARVAAVAGLLALAGTLEASAAPRQGGHGATVRVGSQAQLDTASRELRATGGTVVLRPRLYRELVVSWRAGKRLRIVGLRGTRIERLVFYGARHVSVGRVTIGPIRGDALVDVRSSRRILLHDLVVTARGTRYRSGIRIPDSRHITIRRSDLSHCGDRSPRFAHCVLLWRWASNVVIEDNRFHDCRGCDFVHGRFGSHVTIRRNSFDRALPCRGMTAHRCGHQDLVQFFAGRHLRVAQNHFGVYRSGGAQLYLTNAVDHATIVNNVFVGTDPRLPGYRARIAMVIGSAASKRLPLYAKVLNNTVLTGARRKDGYAGSIRMSSRYGHVLRRKRPIVANNVLGLMRTRMHVCSAARLFARNVVVDGTRCSASDRLGPAGLDARGHPRGTSSVVDAALRRFAPKTDSTGRRRAGPPDIGALEYRPR
jgi:Right handed beta helix region